jgi:hypothetical protein
VSVRIAKNGVKTIKIWLKQGFRGLSVKDLKEQGPGLKKLGTKA